MTSSQKQLTVTSSVAPAALIEYAALCVGGWVCKNFIRGNANDYCFDLTASPKCLVSVKKHSQARVAESQTEILKFIFAVTQLGGTVEATSGWTEKFPPAGAVEWSKSRECLPVMADAPVHSETLLTLSMLGEIYETLADQTRSIGELSNESTFTNLFPRVDFVAGEHENMRHRSGNEIRILWRKREFVEMHKIDAPNPVAEIFAAWLAHSGGSAEAAKPESYGVFHKDGYRGTDLSRWRISKLLGEVPPAHQAEVFSWASDTIWTIEEYHNTRGGVPLPEMFSCGYDDIILSADRDLVFKKSKQE